MLAIWRSDRPEPAPRLRGKNPPGEIIAERTDHVSNRHGVQTLAEQEGVSKACRVELGVSAREKGCEPLCLAIHCFGGTRATEEDLA